MDTFYESNERIYNYIINRRHYLLHFKVNEPNYEDVPENCFDWSNTPYNSKEEELPSNAPKPKGKRVVLSHWYDANLMHDVLSRKLVTGAFHMANLTPMMWYSKKQATLETAT